MSHEINQRVRSERKKQGYLQSFIAKSLNMKNSTYSQMERSGNISAKTLIQIAKVLNIDILYLLYGSKAPKKEKPKQTNIYTTQEESIIKILRNLNSKDHNEVIDYIEMKYKSKKYNK